MLIDSTQIFTLIDTIPVHLTNEQVKTYLDYIKDYSFLITLILGAAIGFGANKLIEYLNFRKTRKYFFFALQTLNEGVTLQIDCYEEYIGSMSSESNFIRPLKLSMAFALKAINIVSYQDIYKILVLKNNDKKKMVDLMNGFNKIQSIIESYEKIDDIIFNSCGRTVQGFGDTMGKLQTEIESYISSIRNNNIIEWRSIADDIENLGTIFYRQVNPIDDITMKTVMDGYIEPLKSYLVQKNIILFQQTINTVESYYHEHMNNKKHFIQLANTNKENLKNIKLVHLQILENYKKYLN